MPPISILVYEDWRSHRLDVPPGPKNIGGGPRVKYARLRSFPEVELIVHPEERSHDIVFADWLYFHEGNGLSDERVKTFLEMDVKFRGIIGTELKFLTWADNLRRRLIENVDVITFVNRHQRDMYRYAGIESAKFLGDPVPEHVFYPVAEKVKRVVCMGQIAWHKRSELVIELFRQLRDTAFETCYLGGTTMWGFAGDAEATALQEQLESVTDIFIENAPQDRVAYTLNHSSHYAHVAWHDTSPISQRECAMSGLVSYALTHPSQSEMTPYRYPDVDALVKGIVETDEAEWMKAAQDAHALAMSQNSYEAVRYQFGRILEGVV